jgi:hypothetical protein
MGSGWYTGKAPGLREQSLSPQELRLRQKPKPSRSRSRILLRVPESPEEGKQAPLLRVSDERPQSVATARVAIIHPGGTFPSNRVSSHSAQNELRPPLCTNHVEGSRQVRGFAEPGTGWTFVSTFHLPKSGAGRASAPSALLRTGSIHVNPSTAATWDRICSLASFCPAGRSGHERRAGLLPCRRG